MRPRTASRRWRRPSTRAPTSSSSTCARASSSATRRSMRADDAPSLDEALDLLRRQGRRSARRSQVVGAEDQVAAAVRRHGLEERDARLLHSARSLRRLAVEAPGADARHRLPARPLRRLRDQLAEGLRLRLRGRAPADDAVPAPAAALRGAGGGALAAPQLVSAPLVAAVHARGAAVLAWTVNDAAEVAWLVEIGVDAIVSDDPGNGRRRAGYTERALNRGLRAAFAAVLCMAGVMAVAGSALASSRTQAVPSGVRVAGIRVGGLTPAAASSAVGAAFAGRSPSSSTARRSQLHPARLAKAYIGPAVATRAVGKARTNVRLVVAVHGASGARGGRAVARRVRPQGAERDTRLHRRAAADQAPGRRRRRSTRARSSRGSSMR